MRRRAFEAAAAAEEQQEEQATGNSEDVAEIAYTSELQHPESHSILPSAETPPMSGLPPPGIRHFVKQFLEIHSTDLSRTAVLTHQPKRAVLRI